MNYLAITARLLTRSFTPFAVPFWGDEEQRLIRDWIKGANFPDAAMNLENAIAAQLGKGWCVRSLSSGRAAIQLALESMKLSPDNEVLLPSFSCASLAMAVIMADLQPVLVDMDEHFNIRFESVLEADSPHVKVIILPHLSGCWARDTEKILEWARSRDVFVVEDCAQAFGLKRGGKPIGTLGDVGVFSSGPGKPIFGPGGGWVISRHPGLVSLLASRDILSESGVETSKRIRLFMRNFPASKQRRGNRMLAEGIASRLFKRHSSTNAQSKNFDAYRFPMYVMSDIEAQLALLQIRKIETIVLKRLEFAARWRERLNHLHLASIKLLPELDNIFSKMLLSFVGETGQNESRALRAALWAYGVEVEPSYIPLHLRPPFDRLRQTSMPMTEQQWRGAFAVPARPNLDLSDWKRIDKALLSNVRYPDSAKRRDEHQSGCCS